jgi:CheY-like chemotaxis protein
MSPDDVPLSLGDLEMAWCPSDPKRREADSARILIVDDDAGVRAVLVEAFRRRSYQVQEAPDGLWVSRALQACEFPFDLVILDWKMPGPDGLVVLQQLRTFAPETQVILVSTAADDQLRREAIRLDAFAVLRKPMSFDLLVSVVEKALHRRRGTNEGLGTNLEAIGGEST